NSIKFKLLTDEKLPETIYTDEWRLKQVLINLLSNAVKFTYYGEISLVVENSYNNSYENFSNNEKYIKFTISDTGIGMNEETHKKLFRPFNKFFDKYNELGSGLGLAISSDIITKLKS